MNGASWTSLSFSTAATMNRADIRPEPPRCSDDTDLHQLDMLIDEDRIPVGVHRDETCRARGSFIGVGR